MPDITVPEVGSRWEYTNGHKPVVVSSVRTFVYWRYEGGEKEYNATHWAFTPGGSFSPLPDVIEPGSEWERPTEVGPYTFVVHEVFDGIVYGRQNASDPCTSLNWYASTYTEDAFRREFEQKAG